ncbi:subtilisin-like protein [Ganoderma leucocontextum]|nr:subtilisin-like protein [Ganoderma leucocontextum]
MHLCYGMFLAKLAAVALANPRPVPAGWTLHRRAAPNTDVLVRISLVQSNLQNLDAYLLDVADPQSPNYGRHWTPAQVLDTFSPRQESVEVVTSWLSNELGLDSHSVGLSPGRDVINLNTTAAEAERIFDTEYNVYRWNDDGSERIGCHEGHNFPPHVSEHVDFVWPTLMRGKRRLAARDDTRPSARRPRTVQGVAIEESSIYKGLGHCDEAVTLECLRALYSFHYELLAPHRNTVGVAEFGMNYYHPEDLDKFFKKFAPNRVGHRPKLISIAEGHFNRSDTNGDDYVEASLDLELMMGLLGHKQEVLLYQTDTSISDPLIADKLLGAWDASYCSNRDVAKLGLKDCGDVPRVNVLSISYAAAPDIQDHQSTPVLQRECVELGKLSLTGITFIASSGDVGVEWRTLNDSSTHCFVNGTLGSNSTGAFVGAFPASCPYVTAVGGTQVSPGKSARGPSPIAYECQPNVVRLFKVHDVETATFDFPSGGGFSNIFTRPRFQHAAVSNYLKHFAPPYGSNVFNRSGRAFPDVSANGGPIITVVNGHFKRISGTSASAPIFASLIAAINDVRIAIGKGPVGWINPALYSPWFVGSFNDVTNGSNPGCGTQGFQAAPGWDPVTGLGTPNFERLLDNFLFLP